MRVSIGNRVALDVQTGKEGETLLLLLTVQTPWGPISNATSVSAQTLRAMLVWLRSNYGTLAYDYVAARSGLLRRR